MDRKKFIPLLLSSAMAFMWGCGEGEIFEVTNDDERVKATLLEKLDSTKKDYEKNVEEFLKPYIEYCKSKKGHEDGCDADIVKFSSSSKSNGGESSKSSSSGNTPKSSSSSKANTSSSVGGNSSSSGSSSSSKPATSSSSVASSSSKKLETKGKCVLTKPDVVYIGDEISWRYLPDEGSLESAEFTWSFNDDQVEKSIVDGKKSGTGTPELLVKFSTKGRKLGPTLTFNSKGFECDNVDVVSKSDPQSSSSEPESSSSEPESSSAASSSSVKGYCAVSARKVFVDDQVDWFIVDAEGHELVGSHQWYDLGKDGKLVEGEKSGSGSTRITVKYSTPGDKSPTAYWGTDAVTCERNELDEDDFDALLNVQAMPVSSSSASPIIEESSSSGEVIEVSSSSKAPDICQINPEECVF